MAQKVMKREEFSKFLNSIKMIQDVCTDCDIQKGVIRQRTNDRHSIVQIDLKSLLEEDTSICFSLLKQKIALLKSFELDDSAEVDDAEKDITLELLDKTYKFTDVFSSLTFRVPIRKFLDNSYVTVEELDKMFDLKEEDMVLSHTITSYMCKRIKAITEGFNSDVVIWNMNGLDASLNTATSNNDNSSQLVRNLSLNVEMPKSSARMVVFPLTLELNSDVEVNGYKLGKDRLLCKFDMKYFGIPITIYAQSQLKKEK